MKAVLQRVRSASVEVEGNIIAEIQQGLLVLLGAAKGDTDRDVRYMAEKISHLRVFPDKAGKMNLSILDVAGEILLVSQFTLLGNTDKGRRPGFDGAASPDIARELYEDLGRTLESQALGVQTGQFGAHMVVSLENDGPVTFLLDSRKG